jgi:hypothetical protein
MVHLCHKVLKALVDLLEAGRLAHKRDDSITLVLRDGRKVNIRQSRHAPSIN